jgi:hypothetical protein
MCRGSSRFLQCFDGCRAVITIERGNVRIRRRDEKRRVVRLSAAEVWSRSGRSKEVQGPDRARLADRSSEANRYIYMYLLASQVEASSNLRLAIISIQYRYIYLKPAHKRLETDNQPPGQALISDTMSQLEPHSGPLERKWCRCDTTKCALIQQRNRLVTIVRSGPD